MASATVTVSETATLPVVAASVLPIAYDAFISYSHQDQAWVDAHLVPALKSASIRVCIDHEDFDVGELAIENMQNKVKASRHVVAVFSSSWLKSEWSRFEFLRASSEDPTARGRKLIPILIERIDLPEEYRQRTYADFTDPANYQAEMQKVIRAVSGAYSAAPIAISAAPVVQLIDLLNRLTRDSKVKSAADSFGAIFQSASEQIAEVAEYKNLHDSLHELQLGCYEQMAKVAARFPKDEDAKMDLEDLRVKYEGVLQGLRTIAQRFRHADTSWIEILDSILNDFRRALEQEDSVLLSQVVRRLDREISRRSQDTNTRLNAAARTLHLSALVKALTRIRDSAAEFSTAPERLQFSSGVDALDQMERNLSILVSLHDEWQWIDGELRALEKNQGMEDLASTWPEIESRLERISRPCIAGNSFSSDLEKFKRAFNAGDTALIARTFRPLRRHVGNMFYQTDVDLKHQCDQLRAIGDPLATLLRVIE